MLIDTARAADYLEQHEMIANSWKDEKGNCCIVGAIIATHPETDIFSVDWDDPRFDTYCDNRRKAIFYLSELVPDDSSSHSILSWSDYLVERYSQDEAKRIAVEFLRSVPPFEV